jgi:hypothetical protein
MCMRARERERERANVFFRCILLLMRCSYIFEMTVCHVVMLDVGHGRFIHCTYS